MYNYSWNFHVKYYKNFGVKFVIISKNMLRIFQVMEIYKKIYKNLRPFEKLLGKFFAIFG